MNRLASASAFAIIAAALLPLAGCACGRPGGVYLANNAVAVEDASADCQNTALVCGERVAHVRGMLVPTLSATRWLVVDESVLRIRMQRTSKLRPEQRLPARANDHRFKLIDLDAPATWSKPLILPNPLDSDDEHITVVRLNGDRLIASVAQRYTVQPPSAEARYVVLQLPDGPWQAISQKEGARLMPRYTRVAKFADLRTPSNEAGPSTAPTTRRHGWGAITSFQELESRGLSRGDWGELFERDQWTGHQTVFRAPSGKEIVVLR